MPIQALNKLTYSMFPGAVKYRVHISIGTRYIERERPPIPFTWRKEKLRLAAVMISGLASTLGILNLAPPTTTQAAAAHTDGIR